MSLKLPAANFFCEIKQRKNNIVIGDPKSQTRVNHWATEADCQLALWNATSSIIQLVFNGNMIYTLKIPLAAERHLIHSHSYSRSFSLQVNI